MEFALYLLKFLLAFSGEHPLITAMFWFFTMGLFDDNFNLFLEVRKDGNTNS